MKSISFRRIAREFAPWLIALGAAFAMAAQAQPETESADPDSSRLTPDASRLTSFDIPAQELPSALIQFSDQTGIQVVTSGYDVVDHVTNGVRGTHGVAEALNILLEGTGLTFQRVSDDTISLARPQGAVAGQNTIGQRRPGIEEIIVTGQKREERIQDVPIAISAFSMEDLEAQKLEGGFDLLKAIPNVTFTKTNFTGYNFSIRGIGTQAISATTDPGVAVAFNSTGLIQNRLFEQEYVDVERVEVLRGPQGTLYGRNATAGVINVITRKPELNVFDAAIEGEIGNYNTQRLRGHVNIPLIDDMLAARLAYASTDRDGYDYNSRTDNQVNGRDLWTGRLTLGFQPTDRIRADLVWEHFEEDDNRSRTSKQLCHRDPGPTHIGDTPLLGIHPDDEGRVQSELLRPAYFSQGCKPGSLYDDDAFGTPNGISLPFVLTPLALGGDCNLGATQGTCGVAYPIGWSEEGWHPQTIIQLKDPYGGLDQSRDLRTIASFRDPVYRAEADIIQLNLDIDLTDGLTLSSQTAYNADSVYSFQDFNRFNTFPIFTDTSTLSAGVSCSQGGVCFGNGEPSHWADMAPGGVFCDPQLGCSDTMAAFDISQAKSRQFAQELRLQSDFGGPINFSLGANYTRFQSLVDYYVFNNLITGLAMTGPFNGGATNPGPDISKCSISIAGLATPTLVDIDDPQAACPYIDPNPIDTSKNFEGEGHNYFRSKNPYELESWAGFGELYYNVTDSIKLTAGLRYTDDTKTFTPVPSQVLLAPGIFGGGTVNRGYPEDPPIVQRWGEWTGRLGVDWKPQLSFTDETMLYAFYSRGYKGGGANPPSPGFATLEEAREQFLAAGLPPFQVAFFEFLGAIPVLQLNAVEYEPTFRPEFVNAYEVGAKNTLLDGALTVNATAFYYDYTDYQVSQIRDRTAVNENFDAEIWGLELETALVLTENFRMLANVGYLNTKIADGETSIDIMNRTQGDPNYTLVKPWIQLPSNCVVPTPVAEFWAQTFSGLTNIPQLCGGFGGIIGAFSGPTIDPATGQEYDFNNYPELNGGAGLRADLGGNELPNSPRLTANIGAEYGRDILDGSWRLTLRTDVYRQSKSWARIYNADPYDRLQSWYNANISARVTNERLGWEAEFYVKNLLDKSPITGAFLNSDDTGLTTNVFTLDPRLIGFSLRKEF